MKRDSFVFLLTFLVVLGLSACGQGSTETLPPPTLSNDQLGTRAAQTAYANFTQEAPVQPSNTPVKNTPTPADTATPLPPTGTQGPTPIPTIDIFGGGQTTIRDDFESLAGWYTGSSDNFLVEFLEGGYHFVVDMITGPAPVYSIRQTSLGDILVSIDVMRFDGKDGGYFGVMCRYADPANYYRFVVYTDGEYEIAKKVGGVFTSLTREELEEPLLIDGSPNNILASCVGNSLKFYLNDELVTDLDDGDLTAGYVGIIAGTDLEPGLDVLFDNFIVSQP